jgi:PAS domain S-box-containing protein
LVPIRLGRSRASILKMMSNIRDYKQIEEELRLSEERLQLVLGSAGDGLWDWNVTTGDLYLSPQWAEMLGFKPDELPANISTWERLVHPDDKPWVMERLNAHIQDASVPYKFDYRLQTKTGEYCWIANYGKAVIRDRQGKPLRMIGTHRDITGSKQAEERLRKSDTNLKTAQRIGKLGSWEFEIQTGKISWSEEVFRIYGRDPATGTPTYEELQQYIHPDDWKYFDRTVQTAINLTRSYDLEHRICRPDGALVYVIVTGEIICNVAGQLVQIVGTILDVSALKRVEAELQQLNQDLEHRVEQRTAALQYSESRLREAQQVAHVGSWELDLLNEKLIWSAEIFRIFGLDPNQPEPTYDELLNYYPLNEQKRFTELIDRVILYGESFETDLQIIRADGSSGYTFAKAEPIRDAAGQTAGLFGITMDISDRRQTEQALRESQQFIQTVFDTVQLPLFWKDRESVYLGCNQQFAKALGIESTIEVIGKTDFDFSWTEAEANSYRAEDRVVMESGEVKLGIEETLTLPSGKQRFLETHKAPLRDWADRVIGVVGTFQDVTDRREVKQRLKQQAEQERLLGSITHRMRSTLNLDEILNATVEEVHQVLHSDRVLVYRVFPGGTGAPIAESVSPSWPKILDISFPEEIFPKEAYDLYLQGRIYALSDREDPNQFVLPSLVKFLADIQVRAKLVVPIVQDQTLWGLLIAHQCDRPRQWQVWEINLLQQVANQLAIAIQQAGLFKQSQTELAERQAAEARLTETNAKLAIFNEELGRATRLKDEFLANMSHELRTPLNAILGMTQGLQEEVFGSVNERQIKALQTVERSSNHLLELIDDILDIAKIESGQIELDCTLCAVAPLCQSSLAFIKHQALKKRIQVEIELKKNLPDILVDERRIRQVLINMLNNAVKFTPEGGHITLEVSKPFPDLGPTDSPPQQFLHFAVIDTGIGISPENIKKLFQPFIQIDSALNRQYAGTGLGLALVKRIVEFHGGKVGLTSELGVGSCFTIDLPYTPSSSLAPEITVDNKLATTSELESTAVNETHTILLAEDNEANISTVSSYLEAKGYRILLARNGQEAIAIAKMHQPDLILMDIQMPVMDGLEATKQIRRDPNLVGIPIIALTALAMAGDREKCLAAGANEYLTKPVKLKNLTNIIQQLLVKTKDN